MARGKGEKGQENGGSALLGYLSRGPRVPIVTPLHRLRRVDLEVSGTEWSKIASSAQPTSLGCPKPT